MTAMMMGGFRGERAIANLRRKIEKMDQPYSIDFPAKLTAESGGYYSWTAREMTGGTRADADSGKAGTYSYNPAKAINGETFSTTDGSNDVWLRPVGMDETLGMVHEIVAGPDATTSGSGISGSTVAAFGTAFMVGTIPASGVVTYTTPASGYGLITFHATCITQVVPAGTGCAITAWLYSATTPTPLSYFPTVSEGHVAQTYGSVCYSFVAPASTSFSADFTQTNTNATSYLTVTVYYAPLGT